MSSIAAELVDQVRTARENQTPLNIVGRNTKTFMGRTALGMPINVADHCGVIDYDPGELVIRVRAGTTLADIDAVLGENDQCLPIEAPRFGGCASIGGTVACNLSGPGRPWRGSAKEMLLGIELISGRGERLNFGGQVVKNVAGFDLFRLQAGAMGTLGVLTEVTLKVVPRLQASKTVSLSLHADDAIEVMNKIAGMPVPLTGACWVDNSLMLRFQGARAAVAATVLEWGEEELEDGDQFWEQLREQTLPYFRAADPLSRFSQASHVKLRLPDRPWLIDWGGALRWLRGEFDAPSLRQLAVAAGGQVSLYRGGDRSQEVFHDLHGAQRAMLQSLKAAFDPDRLFNRGRLFSWL